MRFLNSIKNLGQRMCSMQSLTLLLIWIYMLDLNLKEYRQVAESFGKSDTFAILPFVQTDGYFTKVMLVGVLCFFSNAPFMNSIERYILFRIGRKNWGKRNIAYIFGSSILMALILELLSIVMIIPVVEWNNQWGSIYKTLAVQNGKFVFAVLDETMKSYTPIQLVVVMFIVNSLAFSVIGMLLYTFSLYMPRVWGYFITIVVMFLPTMDAYTPFSMIYYSPFSWINPQKWRYDTMLDKPNLIYIFTAYGLLLFILIVLAQLKIRTVEWKEKEVD